MQCLASQIVCFAETSKPLSNSLCCNEGANFAQNQKEVFSFKVCVNSAYVQTSDETPSMMNFGDKSGDFTESTSGHHFSCFRWVSTKGSNRHRSVAPVFLFDAFL